MYDKGTNRRAFLLGEVDKYSWRDTGSSFGLSDILAAFLYAQLERRSDPGASNEGDDRYREALAPHADRSASGCPTVPAHCGSAHHMFYVLMPSRKARDRCSPDSTSVGCRRPSTTYRCTRRTPVAGSPTSHCLSGDR